MKGMIKGRRESKPKKSLELPKNQTNPWTKNPMLNFNSEALKNSIRD